MKTSTKIIIIFLVMLAIASGVYWYIFFYGPGNEIEPEPINNGSTGGFIPLITPSPTPVESPTPTISVDVGTTTSTTTDIVVKEVLPTLRLISNDPVGGYGASTTASSTVIRWIDRGRGNIFETKSDTSEITTLSNTLLPKTYESIWDKNLTAFIGSLLQSNSDTQRVVYAKLNPQTNTSTPTPSPTSTSTATTTTENNNQQENITPYNLRGKNLPENILSYVSSPKKDKIFMFIKENNQGVGYISNFDGTSISKVYTTPLTEVNIEWPEENTIAITTKGSASHNGFLYFLNPKTGVLKKILGPMSGLSTKVSKDAKYVFFSRTSSDQLSITGIKDIGAGTEVETMIITLADKCVWANNYKELIYCATPSNRIAGTYPDDWYKGIVSFSDKIWQINAKTGDITLITPIINQSDRVIDAFSLDLDPKDNFLFFINKKDLSLWSFDLNSI